MSMEVEVSLKIPTLTLRLPNQPDKRVDNASVRFKKLVELPAIPKPDTSLQMTTAAGQPFECTVIRADWHEERAMFIVSCKYAKRAISTDDYVTLVNDPDWRMASLLPE